MSIIKLNTAYRLFYQLENVTFHIRFPVVWTDRRKVTRLQIFFDAKMVET